MSSKRLWIGLSALLAVSFGVLLWVGSEIHRVMPPIPQAVVTDQGVSVFRARDIERGRQVWQSIGGQQLGSIWGHGSYVAPDWTADWLHREAIAWLEVMARRETSYTYAELAPDMQAALAARLRPLIRTNSYDPATGTVTISNDRAAAIQQVADHYRALFGDDPRLRKLREAYAMKEATVLEAEHRSALTAFIWWSSWSAVTQRPDEAVTYTTTGRTMSWSAIHRRGSC
jgi:nitric oxide reductase subunit B